MATAVEGYVSVGPLEELQRRGCTVVAAGGHTIAVLFHAGTVYAVDNRCPHMGFPLDRGSIKDGILTCHWHHARFDLSSGGTFDPFADDVRTFPVKVVEGEIWVDPAPPQRDEQKHWSGRLEDGMEQNLRLVIAKAMLGLQASGADYRVPLRIGARFGTTYSAGGWGPSLSILTSTANILPHLAEEDRPRALYHGLLQVSRECAGKPPRFRVDPLPTGETRPEVFKQWFRNFIDVRDDEGAERCLCTAIELGLPPRTIADMVFAAATDHIYLDGGHVVDFANKAFELLDHVGWDEASQVLTSLVHGMARARRSQELSSWRNPVDIAAMVWQAREELPAVYQEGQRVDEGWQDEDRLVSVMLEDDPEATLAEIKGAIGSGAPPLALGAAVAHAAFLRMVHFHISNEFSDWDRVHNTLTSANALHCALKRAPSVELLRSVLDTAMSVYLDRFLNMPSQRIPETGAGPVDGGTMLGQILEQMNVQQQVEPVAQLVSGYLTGGADPKGLLATLGRAMLREDASFHWFQIVDAGFNQYSMRRETEAARHVLIGTSRFLAAHSPTPRAVARPSRSPFDCKGEMRSSRTSDQTGPGTIACGILLRAAL